MFKISRLNRMISINRKIHSTEIIRNKNLDRQVKIFRKLLGNRETGSKKKWYPNETAPQQIVSAGDLGKTKKQGKNASRRITVLNKLFMKYITEILATGKISEEILGKNLEISRVNVAPDFYGVNVFWIGRGTTNDEEIEQTLNRCSGIIRHELSQLRLMGEVPRIYFVKDKSLAQTTEIDNILKKCDFGEDYQQHDLITQIRKELNFDTTEISSQNEIVDGEVGLPEMRNDVFGLNHKEIMNKILIKLKKSKDAWEAYEKGDQFVEENYKTILENVEKKVETLHTFENDEKFSKFLQKQKYKKNLTGRKKNLNLHNIQIHDNYEDDYVDIKDGDYIDEIEKGSR